MKKKLNQFFFGPIRQVSLEAFRICLGLVAFAWTLSVMQNYSVWFGEFPLFTGQTAHRYLESLPLAFIYDPENWGIPDAAFAFILPTVLVSALAIALGLYTRVACLLTFVGMHLIQSRLIFTMYGGDTLLKDFIFYLIFSPAGSWISLDFWRSRPPGKLILPPRTSPALFRVMQVQLWLVYVVAFSCKIFSPSWMNGSANYFVTHNHIYARRALSALFDIPILARATTWLTLACECFLSGLLWFRPLTMPIVAMGILLHLSLEASLSVSLWQYVMLSALLLFLPDLFWIRWWRRFRNLLRFSRTAPKQNCISHRRTS